MTACDKTKLIKPVVLNGYIAVNNTIGFLRPVAENPDVIVKNIDMLVRGGDAVVAGLTLIAKYYDQPIVQQALASAKSVVAVFKVIQADPTQVTDKVKEVLVKLEEVRGGFVAINDKLSLGLVFPTPKVMADNDELLASINKLEESTK